MLAGLQLGQPALEVDIRRLTLNLRAPSLVSKLTRALVQLTALVVEVLLEAAKPRLPVGERR